MRAAAVVEIKIPTDRDARIQNAVVGAKVGEWREASQPRALIEPDVNLSIYPAPVIQPFAPGPSERTGVDFAA